MIHSLLCTLSGNPESRAFHVLFLKTTEKWPGVYIPTWSDCILKTRTTVLQYSRRVSRHFCLRPRPRYTVFKRKRYWFVPFSKRFASTLIVSVSFSPVHTKTRIHIENVLKPLFSLHSSSITLLARNFKSCPTTLGFSGLRPKHKHKTFYYHRSAQSWQA